MSELKIKVIIPCYNEGKRLPLEEFRNYLDASDKSVTFLFVNDGSRDNTAEIISSLIKSYPDRMELLDLKKNGGKAEAVRLGMMKILEENVECDYVGFMDADLSTPLSEIEEIRKAILQFQKPAMVFGSRIKLYGSTNIQRSDRRHYVGRVIATMISRSLKLAIYDTQCGFKFFRSDHLQTLFNETFTSRWLFDVEIIFRLLNKYGHAELEKVMFEYPVKSWTEMGDSRIPLSYAFKMPIELWKIRSRYKQ